MSNSFRLQRYAPAEDFPKNNWDSKWMTACGAGFAEVARETLHVTLCVNCDSFFHIFSRIRTDYALILPVLVTLCSGIVFLDHLYELKLDEYGHTGRNFFLVVCAVWGHWYGSVLGERRDRQIWLLQRRLEDGKPVEALVAESGRGPSGAAS